MIRLLRNALLALALLTLAGCDGGGADAGAGEPPGAADFTVLAGSELKDVETQLSDEIRKATGVRLRFAYAGTLDAIDRLNAGEQFDAVWVSHGKYLAMNPALKLKLLAQDKVMLSPVVLGVKTSKARELGWDQNEPTWKDIAEASRSGRFSFGMTNPTSSNTGFTALIGIASALAANPDALTEADVANPTLKAFFQGQRMTSGSSGWLADAYVRDQAKVDGLINYESVLLSLNRDGKLTEPLVLVYPKEGIVTADYPLMLLQAGKRADYDKLIAFLRSPAFQTRLSETTLRRPVNPDATAAAAIPKRTLIELPFPGQPQVIERLLEGFLADVRIPASSRYVLDLSGSMANEGRIDAMKAAMATLAGAEAGSLSGRYARFQKREKVGLLPFSTHPEPTRLFDMGDTPQTSQATLKAIADTVAPMRPDGGTAIFDSVRQALEELAAEKRKTQQPRYYTVVLMSDGENTEGSGLREFIAWHAAQDETLRSIRVFPILFGDADLDEMNALAEATGGKVFDAKSKSLTLVFKDIRGYQ
ncbi:substrate-binding and vWA domain-containing protein [Lysobacter sp. CA199]|uniref:substrate-binding and vWA domain-containing protein n=1 Tax=Lysobacter sp. CA199 TaxID=3455608 RepID=UPI003F8D043E